MAHHEIIFSGSGGQGLMFIGKLLAGLALDDHDHITFFPSYGAEVRGGTSNCQVILSDTSIATPMAEDPDCAVLMNQPSVDRFAPQIRADGKVFVNSSLAHAEGGNVMLIPASDIALEMGDVRAANVVIFAAMLSQMGLIDKAIALEGVQAISAKKGEKAVEINTKAFEAGWSFFS
jgi:2-oxoglutarate ferredoxin oxidoreductase subunit gamma